jgi:hypothetical protein
VFAEYDIRIRTHVGSLSRFYLDAKLGLVAVRTHGAERAVRREHERLLVEWARSSLRLQRVVVSVDGILVGIGLEVWLILQHIDHGGAAGSVLLLVYWALNLPVLDQTFHQRRGAAADD